MKKYTKINLLSIYFYHSFFILKKIIHLFSFFVCSSVFAGGNIGQSQMPSEPGMNPFTILGDIFEKAEEVVEDAFEIDGKRTKKYEDGSVYQGEFADGVPHGYGKMTYSDGRTYTGDHFRQVNDLLGLTSYQDNYGTDRPSDYTFTNEYEADPWAALFSSASEEDRYQYDYSETINYLGGFGQAEYAADGFSAFVQGAVSTQSYQREGRFVGTSGDGLGQSEKVSKLGYNLKGGLGYDIDKQNALFFNSGFYSRQPFLDNIFKDIRN